MTGAVALAVGNPLFGVTATVVAYAAAEALHTRLRRPALLHPVLTASAAVAVILAVTGMPYQVYFAQAFPLQIALGVFVVLLAVPLSRQFALIRMAGGAIVLTLLMGWLAALVTALAYPAVFGAPQTLLATLASKSATTAVAVQMAERLGGTPALTALVVISTGIFGTAFGPTILRRSGVHDDRAIGLALGIAAHAIGTARALQISDRCGAFASLGMILNAGLTILLVPIILGAL
ncbi:Putative effector of murein hydrolase [Tranquillimonas rosea]|uniref:Putative effector of murein hydrolase n=1 Tax=Tranquillimonas rosea TaxID=641238 RepID=A0A1H9SU03_9RHOB|nr:LrgB family protein [Tranquillimonas rosea]SER87873.1 Putative effector of murein hydrolase [Tranquillimonas rosea]